MSHRFFCDKRIESDQVVLSAEEARHLARVMRKKPGDRVIVFDGSGFEFEATVAAIERDEAIVTITQRRSVDREVPVEIWIALALPKGDRQVWVTQKLVELGVARLIPLVTERGVARPRESVIKRLQRQVIEASKQCGRNKLMTIAPASSIRDLCQTIPQGMQRIIADPKGNRPDGIASADTCVLVGPEGGLSPDEVETTKRLGWIPTRFGERILRVETAAITAAAWCMLSNQANHDNP